MKVILFFILLLLYTINSSGTMVSISLFWNRDLQNYNLQNGSIIQVIGYDRNNAIAPGSSTEANFGAADEFSSYNPYTTPINHDIVYQTHISESIDNTIILDMFQILDVYNRIYIRFFSTTNFLQEEVVLSYWGLSSVRNINQTNVFLNWRNIDVDYEQNYFREPYFEVIPEPTTLNLVGIVCILLIIKKIII